MTKTRRAPKAPRKRRAPGRADRPPSGARRRTVGDRGAPYAEDDAESPHRGLTGRRTAQATDRPRSTSTRRRPAAIGPARRGLTGRRTAQAADRPRSTGTRRRPAAAGAAPRRSATALGRTVHKGHAEPPPRAYRPPHSASRRTATLDQHSAPTSHRRRRSPPIGHRTRTNRPQRTRRAPTETRPAAAQPRPPNGHARPTLGVDRPPSAPPAVDRPDPTCGASIGRRVGLARRPPAALDPPPSTGRDRPRRSRGGGTHRLRPTRDRPGRRRLRGRASRPGTVIQSTLPTSRPTF